MSSLRPYQIYLSSGFSKLFRFLHFLAIFLCNGVSWVMAQAPSQQADTLWSNTAQRLLSSCTTLTNQATPQNCETLVADLSRLLHQSTSPTAKAISPTSVPGMYDYFIPLLEQGSLERPLAYLLIELRIAKHQQNAAPDYFKMAQQAVQSTAPPGSAALEAFRLLNLMASRQQWQQWLSQQTAASAVISLASLTVNSQKHYYGNHWRDEMAQALGRADVLLEKLPASRPQIWSGALIGCELRLRKYNAEVILLAMDAFVNHFAPESGGDLGPYHEGARLGIANCS